MINYIKKILKNIFLIIKTLFLLRGIRPLRPPVWGYSKTLQKRDEVSPIKPLYGRSA
jgi:hypothetical protein